MPYPHRNPDDHPRRDDQLDAIRAAPRQTLERHIRAGGHTDLIWHENHNDMPPLVPYVRGRDDAAEAEEGRQAWHAVAIIQARLRGEADPAPVAHPWNLPPCLRCGYRMRCRCQRGA